jgi:succinylglutamic semialdehyde dehydrogenase
MPSADLRQAAVECVRSAFVSAGQRCTCTRRLIVHRDVAGRFVRALCKAASGLILGDPGASHPVFMGPVISEGARRSVLEAQSRLVRSGQTLVLARGVEMEGGGFFVSPGVVGVERFTAESDEEVFGPLLAVSEAADFEDALEQANATRYGLAASLFSRERAEIEEFLARGRAGCLNVNTGTAGASGKLPFGGLGLSGNHRPAGSFSTDYCAYPVASLVETGDAATLHPGMRFEDSWLA